MEGGHEAKAGTRTAEPERQEVDGALQLEGARLGLDVDEVGLVQVDGAEDLAPGVEAPARDVPPGGRSLLIGDARERRGKDPRRQASPGQGLDEASGVVADAADAGRVLAADQEDAQRALRRR
jgi:hypothetical protein